MSAAAGFFAVWQPLYARHGVATFPVKIQDGNKMPAVRGWQRVGVRASTELAGKFATAESFGFTCGLRNGVTVIDMDSTDASIVAEGERLFGVSPVLWRTGGGKFAMPFRWNGEPRSIRALSDDGPSIDLLGGGFVVAPPSAGVKQPYEFIRGSVADFDRLPVARMPKEIRNDDAAASRPGRERTPEGRRNLELFRYCKSTVVYCDTLDGFIDAARTWAEDRFATPLPAAEIVKTCNSVWQYRGGRKRIMNQRIDAPQWAALSAHPELLGVLAYLQAENGPDSDFMIADGLGAALGWPRRLVPAARKTFLEIGIISEAGRRGSNGPWLYRWNPLEVDPFVDIPNSVCNPSSPPLLSPKRVRASEGRPPASSSEQSDASVARSAKTKAAQSRPPTSQPRNEAGPRPDAGTAVPGTRDTPAPSQFAASRKVVSHDEPKKRAREDRRLASVDALPRAAV